jgi:hypothetical protein
VTSDVETFMETLRARPAWDQISDVMEKFEEGLRQVYRDGADHAGAIIIYDSIRNVIKRGDFTLEQKIHAIASHFSGPIQRLY